MNITSNTSIGPSPTEVVYPSQEATLTYFRELDDLQGSAVKKADQYPNPAKLVETGKIYPTYTKARKVYDWHYESHTHESKLRKKTVSKKMQFPFRIKDHRLDVERTEWRLEVLNGEHNHEPYMACSADPENHIARQPQTVLDLIDRLHSAGVSTAKILATSKVTNPGIVLTARDIYDRNVRTRQLSLNGKPQIQWLMDDLRAYNYR